MPPRIDAKDSGIRDNDGLRPDFLAACRSSGISNASAATLFMIADSDAAWLTEHQALRVATLYGAEAIGVQNDLGSIEPGKLADLVIFEQNPLDNIRNTNTIQMVMKNGRLYDGNNLDELWPRQRELGPVYGLGDRPIKMGGEREGALWR